MSSDKKRIERDLFGDDDDEEDDQTYNENNHDQEKEGGENDNDNPQDVAGDEEEESIQLPSFKKRNADSGSPAPEAKKIKSVKKNKAPTGASAENPEGEDDSPMDPRKAALLKLDRDFDAALKSGKTSSRRRRKDDEDIDTELDESASRFVAKMREAAFADIDSKLKNQSALSKVRMLDSVKKQLNKSHVHNTFLDNGILEAMKLWLEPLQDASLPSLDIIQDFLDLLDVESLSPALNISMYIQLPIQTDHLVNSGVGRVVYFYTKVDDSRVTPSIKRKADVLVDKWSRPIVKLSQDYRDKKINYTEGDAPTSNRRRPTGPASSGAPSEPQQKSHSVRVPQIDRGSYSLMPESSLTFDRTRGGKSDKYKKLRSHMTKMKAIKRT
ncbi:Transcription factor iws1 [Entomortierella beljakovae]|nr:Transcription factor iws1 [Entomortierella beljakovae]